MRIALRVEVCSLRGLRQGVPNLMRLFSEYQVRASFFFALGPDRAGRSALRSWRDRGRLDVAALAYGTLIPAPMLGRHGRETIFAARADGHEIGLCGWSPQQWSEKLAYADEAWVREQCDRLWSAHLELGGESPSALATPAWQVHPALLRELSTGRCLYSSLSRGKFPYLPLLQGVRCDVPEVPTTLPTCDEMLRRPGVSIDNVHEYLYAESRHLLPAGHVFALNAEREGIELLDLMEKLLVMWKGQDGTVRALADLLDGVELESLPRHQLGWARPEGGTEAIATQSVWVPTISAARVCTTGNYALSSIRRGRVFTAPACSHHARSRPGNTLAPSMGRRHAGTGSMYSGCTTPATLKARWGAVVAICCVT